MEYGMQTDIRRPVNPASFAATGGDNKIDLTWVDAAADYDIIRIEVSTADDGPWTFLAELAKDVQAYEHSGLTGGSVTRYYRARTRLRNKWSAWMDDDGTTNQ